MTTSHRRMHLALLAACCLAATGCAGVASRTSAGSETPAAVGSTSDFIERSMQVDGIIIGAQPAVADLEPLRAAGVTRVLNLRTPREMAALGFDEAALFEDAGVAYAHSPVGGDAGYPEDVVDAFERERLAAGDGTVLLHCASGARAGAVYAAWLVRYRGASPDEAMRAVEPLGLWPLPLERLLGQPLQLEFATPQAEPEA